MRQPIIGFHRDAEGDWVADLACGHGQHVRHDPPWQVREWVLEPATREAHLGTLLDCIHCDRDVSPATDARMRGLCPEGAREVQARATAPRIGVAVIVRRDDRVLLGRRAGGSHGAGTWQFPGGHLESFEEIEACAEREVAEETGLRLSSMTRGPFTNDLFIEEQRHYVTLFVVAEASAGAPRVLEPAKCAEWRWFDWDALPDPLFLPIRNLRATGYRPPGL